MRGSREWDISSLRALGPGGGQISRVVHVSTRAAFVFLQKISSVVLYMKTIHRAQHMLIGVRGVIL